MTNIRTIIITLLGVAAGALTLQAQDLSTYREFQFGASLPAVAKKARLNLAAVKKLHQRPAVIQELEWQAAYLNPKRTADSVRSILFSFYNGALFRLFVTYDREHSAGLGAEDLIKAISAKYGVATKPAAELTIVTTQLLSDGEKIVTERNEKVIARWEDAQYSYNLLQPYPSAPFNLAIYAKRLEALAQTAITEARQLDKHETLQRARSPQAVNPASAAPKQAAARHTRKPLFRP